MLAQLQKTALFDIQNQVKGEQELLDQSGNINNTEPNSSGESDGEKNKNNGSQRLLVNDSEGGSMYTAELKSPDAKMNIKPKDLKKLTEDLMDRGNKIEKISEVQSF